ncbi:hypothetical protein ACQCSX_22640 (plasmid) [Pseudarthrobacter sp. P1]|uniref:hypothetical protein n=1 Tax=Pseudarthrobacter sp. P1 TaxID=3418418 RepID=UPI003CED1BDE
MAEANNAVADLSQDGPPGGAPEKTKERREPLPGREMDDAQELVMASFRITKAQARALEIVSDLTRKTKAEVVREALDDKITQLTSVESVQAMADAYRERLFEQTSLLQQRLH